MKKTLFILMVSLSLSGTLMAQTQSADATTYATRFDKFVTDLSALDSLSTADKQHVDSTYKAFLAEYKVVKDQMSDEDVRTCSKAKVRYQKAKVRLALNKTSDSLSDTTDSLGKKAKKLFKRTKSKLKGAIDGFKEN